MVDESTNIHAQDIRDGICAALDRRSLKYGEIDKLSVYFEVEDELLPIRFIISVDAQRALISLFSPLPFNFSERMRLEGAIATSAATFTLNDGSFDYDLNTGSTAFRLTASFQGKSVEESLINYMIDYSFVTVKRFNRQFLAIDNGELDVEDFLYDE